MVGGMHGRGVCMARGMHDMHPPGRYYSYGIRSMSGRYASYWNAFLLFTMFTFVSVYSISFLKFPTVNVLFIFRFNYLAQ